jgi:hypothetical protein
MIDSTSRTDERRANRRSAKATGSLLPVRNSDARIVDVL